MINKENRISEVDALEQEFKKVCNAFDNNKISSDEFARSYTLHQANKKILRAIESISELRTRGRI